MNLDDLKLHIPYVTRDDLKALIYEDEVLNIYKNDWQITCYQLWRTRFYHPEIVEPSIFWLSQFVQPQSQYELIFRFRIYNDATVYILVREMVFADPYFSFIVIKRENPRKVINSINGRQLQDTSMLEGLSLGKLLHEFSCNEFISQLTINKRNTNVG